MMGLDIRTRELGEIFFRGGKLESLRGLICVF